MIRPTSLAAMHPTEKAEVIYQQARSEMAGRLWRAALGVEGPATQAGGPEKARPMSLDLLLSLLGDPAPAEEATPQAGMSAPVRREPAETVQPDGEQGRHPGSFLSGGGQEGDAPAAIGEARYGPNAGYAGMLGAAARRTGLPAAALATIVHAEAARAPDGRWLPYSRNPRSSAAGLGQFLSSTWRGEAERTGTWLNAVAAARGWLNEHGKVKGGAKAALLALRYDPEAAIQATADYASANLSALRHAGVAVGRGAQDIARAAYLGHHLGRGDAVRFLKGGLSVDRARVLLNAQVGSAAAARRIAASADASTAHRNWLLDYVQRHIRPEKFSA